MRHKICSLCGKVGHRRDMVKKEVSVPGYCAFTYRVWIHKNCYEEKIGLKNDETRISILEEQVKDILRLMAKSTEIWEMVRDILKEKGER